MAPVVGGQVEFCVHVHEAGYNRHFFWPDRRATPALCLLPRSSLQLRYLEEVAALIDELHHAFEWP